MRVLHVIPVMDPQTGGPPPVVAAVCRGLRARGVEAEIACYSGWPGDGAMQRVTTLLAGEVPVIDLGPLSRGEVLTSASARRVLRGEIGRFDLVHLHGVWDPVLLAAYRLAKAAGVPHVFSTHGTLESVAVARKPWRKELFWRLGWGGLVQQAAAVQDYRPGPIEVLGRHVRPKVWEIANGTEVGPLRTREETRGAWEKVLGRCPSLRGLGVALYVGRVAPEKGLEVLVGAVREMRAAGRWPAARGVMIAGPDYGVRASLEAMGVEGVAFAGALYGEEKAAALAHAEAFVQPSRGEGFSMAILEGMAAGLPAVITDKCHFPRAAAAGAAIEVPAGQTTPLGEALVRVLSEPDAAREMGRRGRALVEAEYTWERIVGRYVEMYESAAGRGAA